MKIGHLILGMAGVSLLLAACSSGGAKDSGPAPAATPTPTAVRAAPATATPTVAPTPPAPAENRPTATPTAGRAPTPTPVKQSPPSSSGATEIVVKMRNNEWPEEIHVKAGSKVVFVAINESDNDKHNFEFPDFGVTYELKARETIRIPWQVPQSKGTWDAGCFLTEPGGVHDGMEGVLIIE